MDHTNAKISLPPAILLRLEVQRVNGNPVLSLLPQPRRPQPPSTLLSPNTLLQKATIQYTTLPPALSSHPSTKANLTKRDLPPTATLNPQSFHTISIRAATLRTLTTPTLDRLIPLMVAPLHRLMLWILLSLRRNRRRLEVAEAPRMLMGLQFAKRGLVLRRPRRRRLVQLAGQKWSKLMERQLTNRTKSSVNLSPPPHSESMAQWNFHLPLHICLLCCLSSNT